MRHSTRHQDLVTTLFGAWMVFGLGLDGWFHNNRPESETFWTPWHAVFYTGFLAVALWYVHLAERDSDSRRITWPVGYKAGAGAVAVFGVAGFADMLWHEIWGVEQSIAALLSPPHIMLLGSAVVILTSPYRAYKNREVEHKPSFWAFMPVTLALTTAFTCVTFFFQYASPYWNLRAANEFYEYFSGERSMFFFMAVALSVLSLILTTTMFVMVALLMFRTWRVPPGTLTLIFATQAVFASGMNAFRMWPLLVGLATACLFTEVLTYKLGGQPTGAAQQTLWAALVPVALSLSMFASLALSPLGLAWEVTEWAGATMMTGLVGGTIGWLAGWNEERSPVTQPVVKVS